MQPQQAPLIFTDAERPLGDRLLKLALETDRVEGYTEPHAAMIARLAGILGAQLGLHGTDLSALKFAALAHDIGEREMKRNYLLQPNELTWEQTLDLWRHPIIGEQAAAELQLPRQTQLLIRWHHEWWNGQGYPDGITGAAIPLGARILRAVDTYCALISRRPYRDNYDLLEAEQIVADQAGIELDPQIVKLLLALVTSERKQREAETWPAPAIPEPVAELEAEPIFELRVARPAEEEYAPALPFEPETEADARTPEHSPQADTLEMAPVRVETHIPEALVESPDLPTAELPPIEAQPTAIEPDAEREPYILAEDSPDAEFAASLRNPDASPEPSSEKPANEVQPVESLEPEANDNQPPAPPTPKAEN